ncbi:unnamed protein product [Mesocestoides corti]|nr:unnamed protein product [Mesocestoides corti]
MDMTVEVVLSLKITGQHVSVPIRVKTRSVRDVDLSDVALDDEGDVIGERGLWPTLSWLHYLLLVLLTILLLLGSRVVVWTLNGNASENMTVQKNLPLLSNPGSASSQSTPRLWSQGYGQPGGSFMDSVTRRSPPKPRVPGYTPPYGDTAGQFSGESPLASRYRGGSSPSRLREAFDNTL